MLEITVCDRSQATGMTMIGPWAVISIKTPGMSDVEFAQPERAGPDHVLRLEFDDVEHLRGGLVAFSREQAHEVWEFVTGRMLVGTEFPEGSGRRRLVVHCNLGTSRSPAVAAAIAKVVNGDNSQFDLSKVNDRVYRLLLGIAQHRGLIKLNPED